MLILFVIWDFVVLVYESLVVNSLFANMTWENPFLFYCEIKVIIIIIIIIIISIIIMIIKKAL